MEVIKDWTYANCRVESMGMVVETLQTAVTAPPRMTSVAVYFFVALVLAGNTLYRRRQRQRAANSSQRPSTPDLEKISKQEIPKRKSASGYGSEPSFRRPRASPYPGWSITTTKPLPYRPFRYGPTYKINMGLRSMHWDEWIELDNEFLKFHALKNARIQERGSKCCLTLPEAMDGALELLEELCSYLPQRYPSMFVKTAVGMDNVVTGERFDIVVRPLKEDPMSMAGRMVQDDLAIMVKGEGDDEQYYLKAGAILLAGFWRLEDKVGMGLSEIHTSGDVPGYKDKLESGMLNFFKRLKPSAPMLRNNYFIQVDDKLAWSESIGDEDRDGIGWFTAKKNKAIKHHHFRSERQSLRRLPRSNCVVFTIRTYFHPITDVAREPYIPGRLASAIRSWDDHVSIYKGKEQYGEVLLEYLDHMHQKQVDDGLDMGESHDPFRYPLPG